METNDTNTNTEEAIKVSNSSNSIPPCNEPNCTCIVKHYHGVKRVDGKSSKEVGSKGKEVTALQEVKPLVNLPSLPSIKNSNNNGNRKKSNKSNPSKGNYYYSPPLRVPPQDTPDPLLDVNLDAMRILCTIGIDDFDKLGGQRVQTKDGSYIFIDRGADILAVAHRDTVCNANNKFRYDSQELRVYTPTLDDRLGCTILLDILDKMLPKNSYDILLTEGEETGRSTAKWFQPPPGKKYKWMFEMDRGGTDIVHYQFTDPPWINSLKATGIKLERGAFSDICYLDHLDICGVNWGVAYYQYHSPNAYCNLDETVAMVKKFAEFFLEHKDIYYPHDAQMYDKMGERKSYTYINFDDFEDDDIEQGLIEEYLDETTSKSRLSYLDFLLFKTSKKAKLETKLEEEEFTLIPYPVGHPATCICTQCLAYWKQEALRKQKRFERWNKAEVNRVSQIAQSYLNKPRGKSTHYSSVCVCLNCKEQRGEICPHSDIEVCSNCKLDRGEVETLSLTNNRKKKEKKTKLSKSKVIKEKAKRFIRFRASAKGLKAIGWDCRNCHRNSIPMNMLDCPTCLNPGDSMREPLTHLPPQREKLQREPMTCNWCGIPSSKLIAVSGGDLVCKGCALYAKRGGLEDRTDREDFLPDYLM